ncbi:hypothetical protein DERP_014566 [Dermatophagoides pteronyssinus]|uniref:Uncharacterized protein n=1 Tax=Dermatophagoides pteronyssinus TaxID=6956 RepID=A0ABQ8IQ18_DERPT|nr:hypothetical protein DERP_014566 [Dermatophagoides pteronyssinus]
MPPTLAKCKKVIQIQRAIEHDTIVSDLIADHTGFLQISKRDFDNSQYLLLLQSQFINSFPSSVDIKPINACLQRDSHVCVRPAIKSIHSII